MRIISGQFKRRPLAGPPQGATTRPMPDLVKEAVFNLLRGHCEDGPVLDLFCGTGTMGLEAVSRGSPRVVLVEKDRKVVEVLEKNIAYLGVQDACEVVCGDALGPAALNRCPRPAHLIFVDPPYEMVNDPAGWARVTRQVSRLAEMLDDTGYLVLRTPWPFLHTVEAPEPPEGEDAPASVSIDLNEEDADDALDAFEAELVAGGARPKGVTVRVDLEIETTIGPETHDYGTTAVHLYMKRR
jgi:16S rRNA (guanine966-N2)-methyltransferase